MLPFLPFLLLQSALAVSTVGMLLSRRTILPPPGPPPLAIPANVEPRARQVAQSRQSVIALAEPLKNQGNHNFNEKPLAGALPANFPLTALPCSPGLYALTNRQTGGVYIGESRNILQRLRAHRSMLERKTHFCQPLQADVDRYGITSIEVYILEESPAYQDAATRQAREKEYIAQVPPEKRYNVVDRRGDRNSFAGKSHTLAFRQRLSEKRKGIPNTTLGRPITIPPFRTRKGRQHPGGTFASLAEAPAVTGMARRDIRRRLEDPLFSDWKDVDDRRGSPRSGADLLGSSEQDNRK